jgi:predicted phosphodiesterase
MQSDVLAMDDPVLLFGGPYSNLQATEALLKEAARLGVPPGRVVCTGDVVAYCGDPSATADTVRAAGIRVVMGNCEESLGEAAPDCACGFAAGSACDRMTAEWYAHANRSLAEPARAWMRALPRRLDIVVGGRRLAVIHGSVSRINRFVFASTPAAEKRAEIDLAGTDGVIGGHCGLPFTQMIGGGLWHNPGAIGLPANDGTPRAWFSLLTPERGGIRIEHRALDYDHRAAAAAMRANGLSGGYADALETGLWPSCDVLPPAAIAARGEPLVPGTVWWANPPNGLAAWP